MKNPKDAHRILYESMFLLRFLYTLLFLMFSCVVSSQSFSEPDTNLTPNEIWGSGLPLIQNYTPEMYQGFNQNWGAVKDSLGVMYFANGNGGATKKNVKDLFRRGMIKTLSLGLSLAALPLPPSE